MINVVQRNHPTGEPVPHHIAYFEGWILGQELAEEATRLVGTVE